ncbi:MAG: acylneuraminate cytidylyltransferase family protein [Alphaproteobacteria bacterium]|nr:acylneuraminate cytidylyltransferase family protein [Alphaproteobacteria bacterium]
MSVVPQRRLAIIPARGGSKRLPRKNVIAFAGKPMLAHTIEAARDSGCFSMVMVSTEDAEIAAAATAADATVQLRPAPLATDDARVVDVCLDVLAREEAAGRPYDIFCCLYPAAPLRRETDVRAVMALIEPGRCDFALAVTTYDQPPHQALLQLPNGELAPMWPDLINRRAADVGPLVVDNGSTYAATVAAFRAHRTFYGPGLRGHLMPPTRSVDIDLPEDLALADYYARIQDDAGRDRLEVGPKTR